MNSSLIRKIALKRILKNTLKVLVITMAVLIINNYTIFSKMFKEYRGFILDYGGYLFHSFPEILYYGLSFSFPVGILWAIYSLYKDKTIKRIVMSRSKPAFMARLIVFVGIFAVVSLFVFYDFVVKKALEKREMHLTWYNTPDSKFKYVSKRPFVYKDKNTYIFIDRIFFGDTDALANTVFIKNENFFAISDKADIRDGKLFLSNAMITYAENTNELTRYTNGQYIHPKIDNLTCEKMILMAKITFMNTPNIIKRINSDNTTVRMKAEELFQKSVYAVIIELLFVIGVILLGFFVAQANKYKAMLIFTIFVVAKYVLLLNVLIK